MKARVGTYHVDPDYFDEALAFFDTDFAKEYGSAGGRLGGLLLGDRRTGKLLGISFWESDTAMEASEDAAQRLREEVQKAGHGDDPIVREDFEILSMRLLRE